MSFAQSAILSMKYESFILSLKSAINILVLCWFMMSVEMNEARIFGRQSLLF